MATKKTVERQARRARYSAEFKQQALLRAVKDGVPAAARELGLEPAQLYAWRSKAHQHGQNDEAQRLQGTVTIRVDDSRRFSVLA